MKNGYDLARRIVENSPIKNSGDVERSIKKQRNKPHFRRYGRVWGIWESRTSSELNQEPFSTSHTLHWLYDRYKFIKRKLLFN